MAALSASSAHTSAIVGKRRLWSMACNSRCRLGMAPPLLGRQQLVIRLQIDVYLTQRRYLWNAHQVAHCVKGGNLAVLQKQADGRFHLALRDRRGQVQHAHVVPISVLGQVLAQGIVGLTEGECGKQVLAGAVVGKRARLARLSTR